MSIKTTLRWMLTLAAVAYSLPSFALQIIYFDTAFEAEAFCQNHECLHILNLSKSEPLYKVVYQDIQEEPPVEEPIAPPEEGEESPPLPSNTFTKGLYFFDNPGEVNDFCNAHHCVSDIYEYYPYSPNPPFHQRSITVYVVHAAFSKVQELNDAPEIKLAASLREVINTCYSNPSVRCSKLIKISNNRFKLTFGYAARIQYPTPTPMPIKPGEEKDDDEIEDVIGDDLEVY